MNHQRVKELIDKFEVCTGEERKTFMVVVCSARPSLVCGVLRKLKKCTLTIKDGNVTMKEGKK